MEPAAAIILGLEFSLRDTEKAVVGILPGLQHHRDETRKV
jgi:hypothetical protein